MPDPLPAAKSLQAGAWRTSSPTCSAKTPGKALAFVDALRDAKIRLSWTLTNQWKAVYKGRNLCRITLSSGQSWAQYRRWVVTAYLERLADYEQTVCAEGLEEYLWKHVFYCVHKPADADPPPKLRQYAMLPPCNAHGCAPGKTITVCRKNADQHLPKPHAAVFLVPRTRDAKGARRAAAAADA